MSYNKYKFEDYEGKTFGYLTVIADAGRDKRNKPQLLLKCKCGVEKVMSLNNLIRRGASSCGCKSKYHFLEGLKKDVCGIYKIENSRGEIYIGQSRDMLVRWRGYAYAKSAQKILKVRESILQEGLESHKFYVIHQLPVDVTSNVLDKYEQLYMDMYRDSGVSLLNTKEAGINGKHGNESISKMKGKNGKWMLGRKIPKEVTAKGIVTRKKNNKPLSEESRQKYRNAQLGSNNTMAILTERQVLKIIELRKTQKLTYLKLAKKFGVSVACISNIFNRGWGNIPIQNIKNEIQSIG